MDRPKVYDGAAEGSRFIRRLGAALLVASGAVVYLTAVATTREFNPFKMPQAIRESVSNLRQSIELETTLFGEDGTGGLADVNGDGLSLSEKVEAHERMGFIGSNYVHFPEATVEQFQRAIDSYNIEPDSD